MALSNLLVKDGAGNNQNLSASQDATNSNYLMSTTNLADPTSGNKAAVVAFHNADNQALGTVYGLNTGGVAQLLNYLGNIDRQREIYQDNTPPTGISAGGASFAMTYKTTSTGNLASGAQTYTPAAMSGNIGGVSWKIQVGSVLLIDTVASGVQETVQVTSVAPTTFTATFANAHNGSGTAFPIVGFTYNMERDASGENDSATGAGTAVAAEYEYNGVDPVGSFDRARNVQAKGLTTATISAGGGAGSLSLTLSGAPAASGIGSLQPGMKVILSTSTTSLTGTIETAQVGLNYVQGSTTVPLTTAIINNPTYTKLLWDSHATIGPQKATFTHAGVGIEALALTDPVTGFATQARQAPGGPGVVNVSSDGDKATYRAAVQAFAPVAAPTSFFQIVGSASKTIRIKRISISGVATANGNMQVQMSRWSSVGTPGSAVLTAVTAVKHDTNDAGATATINTVGTANYGTQGTGFGTILSAGRIQMPAVATGLGLPLIYDFSTRQDKAFVLRGTTDILSLSGNASAIPTGGVLDLEVEWEEDNS